MEQPGAETLYVTRVNEPAANVGVAIESATPGSLVDPWFLRTANERTVQGYAGTPVNVNDLLPDWHTDVGAAGASFPKLTTFYVAVDSAADQFTHRSLAGAYRLRSWVNDVRPPRVRLLTTRVAAGRPTIVARVQDVRAGVDPLSLTLAYRGVLVGASEYDPSTGLTLFPLPREARELPAGVTHAVISASDYQEGKNISSVGDEILPNTAFRDFTIRGVSGPALTWVLPAANQCVAKTAALVVTASSTRSIRSVRFFADGKQIGVDRTGADRVYTGSWGTRAVPAGPHLLRAVATDAAGREVAAQRRVRVCR
jgi:Bacterial Ig domain